MTDLTILIAVIALALWPLAFLVLRIRHERKNVETVGPYDKGRLGGYRYGRAGYSCAQKIGCQPETNEEGHIVFKYQGDDFILRWRMRPGSS